MEQNQPGFVKDNAATRMAEFVRGLNSERGTAIARSSGEAPMVMAKVVPASMAAPLSEEEIKLRDEAAAAIGIMPKPEGDPLDMLKDTEQGATLPYEIGQGVTPSYRGTAREFVAEKPRMMDFKRIQGIDLIRGVVWVDGFEIKMPEEHVNDLKKYSLELAVDFVTGQLAAAMAELLPPKEETNGADTQTSGETVPEVQDIPPDK